MSKSKRKPITGLDDILNPNRNRPVPPIVPAEPTAPEPRVVDAVESPKPAAKPAKTASNTPKSAVKRGKDKETYYLPIDLIERLERNIPDMRRFTRGQSGYKTTKSDLVAALMAFALDDLEQHGEQSRIVALLLDLLNAKAQK